MLNKPLSVLKALLAGSKVTLNGIPCVLEKGRLYTVATRYGLGGGNMGEVLLPFEMSLGDFLAACERLPDAEVFALEAWAGLADEARSKLDRAGG